MIAPTPLVSDSRFRRGDPSGSAHNGLASPMSMTRHFSGCATAQRLSASFLVRVPFRYCMRSISCHHINADHHSLLLAATNKSPSSFTKTGTVSALEVLINLLGGRAIRTKDCVLSARAPRGARRESLLSQCLALLPFWSLNERKERQPKACE